MLLYLIWALTSCMPAIEYLEKLMVEKHRDEIWELCKIAYDEISKGIVPRDEIYKLANITLELFPKAWCKSMKKFLEELYGCSLAELITMGEKYSTIDVEYGDNRITLRITEKDVEPIDWSFNLEKIFKNLSFHVVGGPYIIVKYGTLTKSCHISSPLDVLNFIGAHLLQILIAEATGGLASTILDALLVDGRTGLLRLIIGGLPITTLRIRKFLLADVKFLEDFNMLATEFAEKQKWPNIPALKDLFEDLGFKITVKIEHYTPRVYIKTWTGLEMPLEKALLGIREMTPIIFALLSDKVYYVFIEEPEVHVHPTAIKHLTRLIAYGVRNGKKMVLLTSHNDYLVYVLNNLILLSSRREEASKLGYDSNETLKPSDVAVYLLKRQGRYSIIEQLEVKEHGFSEKAFEQVVEELSEERTKILESISE